MPYPDSASLSCCRTSSTSTNRRRRPISPSSSVLTLLAAVAADSCVNAAPTPFPLPFLYPPSPSLRKDHELASNHKKKKKRRSRTNFPDKYVKGDDGRWRKTDTFIFNGYAFGNQTEGCGSRTAIDDAATSPSATISSVTMDPSPTCVNGTSFMECLPNGWKPKDHNDRTSLIVTISLVLAFFICFFIIGCLLWRKSMRRMRDIEQRRHRRRKKKATRQAGEEEEEEARSMLEKEIKTKKKIWANATARWKTNAHYMGWRRRGKRTYIDFSSPQTITPSRPASTTHSRPTSPQVSRVSTPEPSRPSSRRPSVSEPEPSSSSRSPPSPPPPPNSPSTSPPAYQHPRSNTHAPDYSPPQQQATTSTTKAWTPLESISGSSRSICVTTTTTTEADSEIPYTSTTDSGHVATDDKAFLERLTYQASAPPGEEESSSSADQIFVPVWRDEEISDFVHEEDEGMSTPNGLFPPPPMPSPSEKGKMAIYYDYTFEEEGDGGEGSAPPFEETEPIASAPPEEDELEYVDEPSVGTSATGGTLESSGSHPERRDSSLQQLGLDFENGSSLPHDLPVYRP
ncbi:hypothetical protein E1B28_001497 [Marasmius oreades]|uniref:Uncharacterized protein n=1 Tax=Marasmius oreades TaxID=181124 RepID=A0A9P8AFG7_9AGAR|nr:uncharacterized protein E1B28_001497 [Marasmius oreades]KAG7099672.1 hypothetical protein E1B28_001497 [Marasmius oreades]